jgi:hypothetical protein
MTSAFIPAVKPGVETDAALELFILEFYGDYEELSQRRSDESEGFLDACGIVPSMSSSTENAAA